MSTTPVTLDTSTLKPIAASAPAGATVTLDKSTLKPLPTERAMQQTMGGPPMFVDVPKGQKEQFEQAGQKGYQTGGIVGAGLVAGAGTLGAAGAAAFAPTAAGTETVGTGILDSLGNEITREVTRVGPSAARAALSNPVVQKVLWHVAGSAAAGAGVGGTFALLKKLGVF